MKPKLLVIACDAFLAGIYGRKFELSGWDVDVVETIADGEHRVMKWRPDIVLLDVECESDIVSGGRRLNALPTWQQVRITLLASDGDHAEIQQAKEAGAEAYLIAGHFVPQEAVAKLTRILNHA